MAALERGIEWLRPLVSSNQPWEYCVIWKLGDDPSRFIEWGACCCSGGRMGVKGEDSSEKKLLIDECRDDLIKHSVSSDACKKLAQLPSVIPLYSGIHGDVVISKRPRWTTQSNAHEQNGTQVLIPIKWGLIELYTSKHMPRDQKIIDYVCARFRGPPKKENMMMESSNQENMIESSSQGNSPPSLHYQNLGHQISQPTNYSSFEGSSTCSSLSTEPQLVQLGHDHVPSVVLLEKLSKDCVGSSSRNPRLRRKRHTGSTLTDCTEIVGTKKGPFKSKNLETERNRRKRIKDRELALRALVPNITKMDKLAILTDAADYIKELVQTISNYQDELETLVDEGCNEVKAADEHPVLVDCADKKGGNEKTQTVVGIEVVQVGKKDFLVKIISKQKRGSFSQLMEAFDCLGLQVADANVTTLHGLVSNVLTVEANGADLDPNALKHSLVQLVN